MTTNNKILEEITRRVLEQDNKSGTAVRHTEELEDHISALEEVTRLPRREIQAIAYEVGRWHQTEGRKRVLLVSVIIAALIFLIGGTVFFGYLRTVNTPPVIEGAGAPPLESDGQLPPIARQMQEAYIQRAAVAQVIASLSMIKVMLMEHYLSTGKYPENIEILGLKKEEMNDGRYIEQVGLLRNGIILAKLSGFFGVGKLLALVPESIMGGTQVRWQCVSNIEKKVFSGPTDYNFCESNATLMEQMQKDNPA